MMNRGNFVMEVLDEIIPNPVCELRYSKDYELLIAVMLSAQCTDKRVNMVTGVLFDRYRSLEDFDRADISDIEEIIRPCGSYRKKSLYIKDIAKKLVESGGMRPDRELLESLSGIGRKSCNVVLGEIYGVPAMPVDTHIERVSKRLGLCDEGDSVQVVERKLMGIFPRDKWIRVHKQLVLFGRYHCKSVKPECEGCRFRDMCIKWR